MVRKEFAKGFESYKKSAEELSKEENTLLYILFVGEKNDKGVSWCCDCNDAMPVINQAIEKFARVNDIVLTVDVGDRPFWKDMKNPFRHDGKAKLTVIPTILRWQSVLRLEGDQCNNLDLLEMFFKEE